MSKKTISLDTREQKDEFIAYLIDTAHAKGYDVHLEALPFGDIKFENIIIERKEINDFCASVCSDRMFNQIAQMKANPDYVTIIGLSGAYKDLWKDNIIKIPHMEGALKQIMAWGIPVMACMDDKHLVDNMLAIFEHSKPIDVPIKRVEKNKKDSLFMALPGIGRKHGKELIAKYGNMCNLCKASKEELIKLLGPVKGTNVYNAVRK